MEHSYDHTAVPRHDYAITKAMCNSLLQHRFTEAAFPLLFILTCGVQVRLLVGLMLLLGAPSSESFPSLL
jgi:predicted RND superfamily exporter protein